MEIEFKQFHARLGLAMTMLLLAFLFGACDNKTASPIPTAPSAPPNASVAPVVQPPVIVWHIERTAAYAGGMVLPNQSIDAIEIWDSERVVTRFSIFDLGDAWGWYWVRGQVNGQWSALTAFLLQPNPCGGCLEPPQPPPPVIVDVLCGDQNLPTPYPNPDPNWCKRK